MTDNEIIKALEYCVHNLYKCPECPYNNETVSKCSVKLKFDTIDLINRQQAEIERAKEINEQLYEEMSERQKEEVSIAKRMARKKAIKEFADRLKINYSKPLFAVGSYNEFIREVDNLVKEMVGDTE